MSRKSTIPTFNMKVVVQETGLSPDTLRAWERRYGMPAPERTEGGHRLYSQYEIDMLKWLMARQEEGLSISHAVELWQRIEEEGRDPLAEMAGAQAGPATAPPIAGESISQIREAWLEACLKFDEYRAQHILAQAFALFSIETVCFEILQKSLNRIGQGWQEGVVTVQQEHFASALALRQLETLLASMASLKGNRRLLIACPPKEQHTFSALFLALVFRRRNWDVVYLGANVPAHQLETALNTVKPELVILTAQTLYTAGTMLEMVQLLRQQQVPFAFGGAVFSHIEEIRAQIPGFFLGTELRDAPEVVEDIIQTQPPMPEVKKVPQAYQEALAHFRNRRPAVEAHIHRLVNLDKISPLELIHANEELGNNIEAALLLGDMDLLTANINWAQGLLVTYHYRMPVEAVGDYLKSYTEAVKTHLDERGEPVRAWFEKLLKAEIPYTRYTG